MAGYIGSKASVVSSGAERKKTFTITGATTSLTGLNYTVGKVHVFQNGVRLVDGTDYTATNGTTITLTVAAQNGDNVVVISQAAFQVADAFLTSGGTLTGLTTVNMGAETSPLRVGSTGNDAAVSYSNASTPTAYNVRAGMSDTDDFSIWTSDTKRLTVKDNGNVGISTNSPGAKLTITDENAGQAMLQVRNFSTSATGSFGNDHSAEFRSATSTTTHGVLIHHNENAIGRRTLDVSDNNGIFASFVQGKVGIGETSPDRHLHVKSGATNVVAKFESTDATAAVEFTDNAGSAEVGTNAGAVVFYPSGAEKARISTQGYLTTPYQPAFYAYALGGGIASSNSYTTPGFDNVSHNIGNHYSTSTVTFTAPVAGYYYFHFAIYWNSTNGYSRMRILKNSSTIFHYNIKPGLGGDHSQEVSGIISMSANDTVKPQMMSDQSNNYFRALNHTYFEGYLLG